MKESGVRGSLESPLACLEPFKILGYFQAAGLPQTPAEVGTHPLARGWSVDGKLLPDGQYAKEVEALNRVYKSFLDLADDGERDRALAAGTVAKPSRDTILAVHLDPPPQRAFLQACLRAKAVLRGTQCLVALRRWQFDHPQPPPDLATLAKAVGWPAVPADPYTDQPLRMTTHQGQPVIYSIGPDGDSQPRFRFRKDN